MYIKVLFTLAAAITGGFAARRHIDKEELLARIAKDFSQEDYKGCRDHIAMLAHRFGHQDDVKKCIVGAIQNSWETFGAADARALNNAVRAESKDPELSRMLQATNKVLGQIMPQEVSAHNKMVDLLAGFTQVKALAVPAHDSANSNIPVTTERMSPREFLSRDTFSISQTAVLKR